MCNVATECQISSPGVVAFDIPINNIWEFISHIALYANCQYITKNGIPMKLKFLFFLIMPEVIKLYIWEPHTFSVKGL